MVDDARLASETVTTVLGHFPSDWRPGVRSLVEDALSGGDGAAQLLAEFTREPWGRARDEVNRRLTAAYLASPELRRRFDAEAATTRLLSASLELAQEAEAALRVPGSEVRRAVGEVVAHLAALYPRVHRMMASYHANSDLPAVRAQLHRALGAVLFAESGGRARLTAALAEAAGRSVVLRWQGGDGPEWLPQNVRFVLRQHPPALQAFELFLRDPRGVAAAARFVEAVIPIAMADAVLRRSLLVPEIGGMGPGSSIDLQILEPEGTGAWPPYDSSWTGGAPPPWTGPYPSVPAPPAPPAPAYPAPPSAVAPPSPPAPPAYWEPPAYAEPPAPAERPSFEATDPSDEPDVAPEPAPDEAPSSYRAYPVLRPAGLPAGASLAVSAGDRFLLEVGIGPSPDRGLVAPREGVGAVRAGVLLKVQLVFDPSSFRVDAPRPIELLVTDDARFPTVAVDVEVLPLDDPAIENRRIAAHYYVDDELRAVVFRTFREAGSGVATEPPTPAMIDLAPLLDVDPPEIVLAIYAADSSAPGKHMMAVFPRSAAIPPPEVMRVELDPSADGIMTQMYELASSEVGSSLKGRTDLVGKAATIGDAMPDPLLAALRAVASAADARSAPRMLLLTEEARLPWELAAFGPDRALTSKHGGDSPFLGAHFAIGRWPLSASRREQPVPRRDPVRVQTAALVSAEYDGAEGWDPLDGAIAEVKALEQSYGPAVVWPPLLDDVLARLADEVDVVHFALHGQYGARDTEEGLVLLKQAADRLEPTYLGADTIRGRATQLPSLFPRKPFVFLNACQVGQHRRVLGDYAGLAVALLRAGARGVVACIWNVDDGIAGSISRDFYRRADDGEAPAEILRAVRARWKPNGDAATGSPTLLAYQYFGHPNLQVQRAR